MSAIRSAGARLMSRVWALEEKRSIHHPIALGCAAGAFVLAFALTSGSVKDCT